MPRLEAEELAMEYLARVKIPEQAKNTLVNCQVANSSVLLLLDLYV